MSEASMNTGEKVSTAYVAYHEAGHAVIAWDVGFKPKKCSIVAEGMTAGHIMHQPPWPRRNPQHDPKRGDEERALSAAMVALAGPIAQKRHNPNSVRRYHGSSDRLYAYALSELFCQSEAERQAWLNLCIIRAEERLEAHWSAVKNVAEALIEHQTLNSAQIKTEICRAYGGDIDPGYVGLIPTPRRSRAKSGGQGEQTPSPPNHEST